ncbi:MAG: hypothetical protein MHPSP_002048 [Paramarteilia canceri]
MDFVNSVEKISSEHHEIFRKLENIPGLDNASRLSTSLSNFLCILNGDQLSDQSYFIYIPTTGQQSNIDCFEIKQSFQFILCLAKLIGFNTSGKLLFTVLLDRTGETRDNILKILSNLIEFRNVIKHMYLVESGRSKFSNYFTSPSKDPFYKQILEFWGQNNLSIVNNRDVPIDEKILPTNFNGLCMYDIKWWVNGQNLFIKYLSELQSLGRELKFVQSRFFEIWTCQDSNKVNNFISNHKVRSTLKQLDFKVTKMQDNREKIMEYFTENSKNTAIDDIFFLQASQVASICQNFFIVNKNLNNEHRVFISQMENFMNLELFLETHSSFVSQKIQESLTKSYSIKNLVEWLDSLNENITCEKQAIIK